MKKEIPTKKKTRILAVGDIHGDSKFVERLAKKAKDENVDLVIIAGDLTWLEQSTKNLIGPFVKENKEVILIPGNHETMSTINTLTQIYPGTRHIHGYAVKKGDVGIFGSGYNSSAGPFWIEDEEIFKMLKKGNERVKDFKKKIMVTHAHPKGSVAEFSGFPGSKAVEKAIKEFKPDILIAGHMHEAGGLQEKIGKTRVIHVARKPIIFEI
ncbi:MAG: metallophosphoesterase [Candidatus Pacearchaeota archaeon]|nr:metallophosphoesterase [Candidatus Pacearchaeota archaeon]